MSGLLKITSLLVDKTFVSPTRFLIRHESRKPNGDLVDDYEEVTALANVQPGAATNMPNLLMKDEGEREFPRVTVYTSQVALHLGDFVFFNNLPYRVFRIEPWSLHGHYHVTAVQHLGPQGARSPGFEIT